MKRHSHKIMYYETDKMGITHHSNYIRFMEEARVDFLEQIGWPYEKLEEIGCFSPVIAVSCQYKTPSTFGEIIYVEVFVEDFSGARLKIGYKMTNAAGKTVCEAESEHCFTNRDGRPIRLRNSFPEFAKVLEGLSTKE